MFTGIIESTGIVKALDKKGKNINIIVKSPISRYLRVDESLCHNGVCLTITHSDTLSHSVTLVNETLQKSSFSNIIVGSILNLERSLKVNGRLDGHIVQGHVDCTTKCINKIDNENSWVFTFSILEKFSNYVIEKGSICVNGVSLTCFDVTPDSFSVAIIPHTFENTNFKFLKIGDIVNIEFDILGKYIQKAIQR